MVRVQIQLEPAHHRALKRRAREQGLSVAEVVRRCIAADAQAQAGDAREDRLRKALAVLGKYRDPQGPARMSREHDAVLARAYRR